MPGISKDNQSHMPLTVFRWFVGYLLPGLGLLVLGFFTAALAPADAIGLGGFLCFFTLGISLIAEGTKKRLAARRLSRQTDKK